jgi:hypothetical protein
MTLFPAAVISAFEIIASNTTRFLTNFHLFSYYKLVTQNKHTCTHVGLIIVFNSTKKHEKSRMLTYAFHLFYTSTCSGRENNRCSDKWWRDEYTQNSMRMEHTCEGMVLHLSRAISKWKKLPWNSWLRIGPVRQGSIWASCNLRNIFTNLKVLFMSYQT